MKKITLFLILALLVAAASSAYVLLSPRRTWDNSASYVVDNRGHSTVTDNDGGVSNVVQAVRTWGNMISSSAGSVAGWQLGDGIPMINFRDPEHACNGSCLAATFTGYYQQRSDGTYRIYDADIVTSTNYDFTSTSEPDGCSSEIYIEGVQVHEAGHGIGLGHSSVSGSTMYPSVAYCDNGPASLSNDDKAAVQDLYGGGGGPGGGTCDLKQKGESCSSDAECCSGKCRGSGSSKTCK